MGSPDRNDLIPDTADSALDAAGAAWRREQMRQHRIVSPTSLLASAMACALALSILWEEQDHTRLLAWASGIGLTIVLRLWVYGLLCRSLKHNPEGSQRLLQALQLTFLIHGISWGAWMVWLTPALGRGDYDLLVTALVAVSCSALIATAFDLTAATAFAVPAMMPAGAHLAVHASAGALGLAAALGLFILASVSAAIRVNRMMREAMGLRLLESGRAATARRHAAEADAARRELAEKHYVTQLLLLNSQQGFWFLDAQGRTTDANPAMCALLGRTRDEILGRPVTDFFPEADHPLLRSTLTSRLQGHASDRELSITRPDGVARYCLQHDTPLRDQEGQVIGTIGIWTDITPRREAELLRHTYEVAVNAISDPVSVINADKTYRLVNDAWCRTIGRSRTEVLGHSTFEVLSSFSTDERRDALARCIETEQVTVVQDRLHLPHLGVRHMETTYYPFVDPRVQVRSVVMVTRDITEQETNRRRLEASEEYLRRTLNATGDAIFATDATQPGEPLRFINDQMLEMWDIPADLAPGLTPEVMMVYVNRHFADPLPHAKAHQDIVRGNVPSEGRVRLKDGRTLMRRFIPAQIDGRTLRVWSFRDITAEMRALQEIKAREAELQDVLDAIPGYITRTSADHRFTYVNARMVERYGQPREAIIGRQVESLYAKEYVDQLLGFKKRLLNGETVTYEIEHLLDGGEVRTHHVTLAVQFNAITQEPTFYSFAFDITDRKRAEQALQASSAQLAAKTSDLQLILDSMTQGILSMDTSGGIRLCNQRAIELLDLQDLQERLQAGELNARDIARFQAERGDLLGMETLIDENGFEHPAPMGARNPLDNYVRKVRSGAMVEFRTTRTSDGGLVRTFTDVTEDLKAKRDLFESVTEMTTLLDSFPGFICAFDRHFCITYINQRLAHLFGLPRDQIVGLPMNELAVLTQFNLDFTQPLTASAGDTTLREVRYGATSDRPRVDMEVLRVAGPVRTDGRQSFYAFGVDITARKQAEARIHELAFFDPLTHLPNRQLLRDRLHQAMTTGNRNQVHGAVFFIDLDNFKSLNDTLGHQTGDELLKQTAQRVAACVREGDTVARLGGDEFVVVLEGLSANALEALSDAESVGEKVLASLHEPYLLGGLEQRGSASMGATLFLGHDHAADDLLKQAELAMYKSKEAGRNNLHFFDPAMQSVVVERATLEADLHRAIERRQFELLYQPQVDATDRVLAAEALIRWLHPDRGTVHPIDFVLQAEDSGQILAIGQWVLETACAQLVKWADLPNMEHIVLSVNVSVRQLQHPDFVDGVVATLARTGANPRRLMLELTESLLVSDIESSFRKMTALNALGVTFSLDDFGTGYASLSYLSRLPFDQIKIDRSFVMNIEARDDAVAICNATLSLARSLRKTVVAEGVETEAQRYFLSTVHHCDLVQGFLISPALSVDQLEAFVAAPKAHR